MNFSLWERMCKENVKLVTRWLHRISRISKTRSSANSILLFANPKAWQKPKPKHDGLVL